VNQLASKLSGIPDIVWSGSCPICGSLRMGAPFRSKVRELVRCADCGLGFVSPMPEKYALEEYFESSSSRSEAELIAKFEANRSPVLRQVALHIQRIKERGRVLDVGCANGYFLSHCFSRADWDLWGVELSRNLAERASRTGVHVHCGTLDSACFPQNTFDVVTILDAFYYLADPRRELKAIARLLAPGGTLVIELPSANARIWRGTTWLGRTLSRKQSPLLETSDHLFYYTPKALEVLLGQAGFFVQAMVPLPANAQQQFAAAVIYGAYSRLTSVLWRFSRSAINMAPRFLTMATVADRPD
jgi:SAM-dependent methyltransferase